MIRMMTIECPSGHAILGAAYDEGEHTKSAINDQLITNLMVAILGGLMGLRCDICGAPFSSWSDPKDRPSPYATMAEAEKEIEKLNAKELARMDGEKKEH